MIRCLITNGSASLDESSWLLHLATWMERGVDLIQIRERDLTARQLADLTRKVLCLPNPRDAKILVNDRADVALACGAHGVHLRDNAADPAWFRRPGFLISAACHRVADLPALAAADYIVLAPIFPPISKAPTVPALGLTGLSDAAAQTAIPILALGGITLANEQSCLDAGASGIAGITYFDA